MADIIKAAEVSTSDTEEWDCYCDRQEICEVKSDPLQVLRWKGRDLRLGLKTVWLGARCGPVRVETKALKDQRFTISAMVPTEDQRLSAFCFQVS